MSIVRLVIAAFKISLAAFLIWLLISGAYLAVFLGLLSWLGVL